MIKFFLFLFLSSSSAFALDAVVTVLETPMLKSKSYDAPVVQYLRKGDVIKIHPSLANGTEYIKDEFIPTLDRQGNTVYVLSAHLYVYFNDSREFSQTVPRHDPTDYRLEEPLPKRYPLKSTTGYRGQFILGVTQPHTESYPYKENVRTKGYMSPVDANITLLKIVPGNYFERMFVGGTLNVRAFENSFSFEDRRFSKEQGLKIGLGPTISYDAFKGEKNRLNLSGSVIVNFFNQLIITQSQDEIEEERTYRGYSLGPRINLQYHRKQVLEDIDFILGTSMEMETATSFEAKDGGAQASWWRALGNDQFMTRTTFNLSGYLGIQSAY